MSDAPRSALLSLYLGLGRLIAPAGPVLLRRRLAKGKEDPARYHEKLGRPTLPRPAGRLIWLHAVSVGEGLSVLPLLNRLVAGGDVRVLVTSTTVTSARLLAERLPAGCFHQFLPLDLPQAVAGFLDHWRPDAAVFVESEFWPRLLLATRRRGIPLFLVNARISEKSARNWRRVPRLARALLGSFTALSAPDQRVADLLAELGAKPEAIRVTASLKRAIGRLPVDATTLADLRQAIGARPCWLAASTHPGEEDILFDAYAQLLAQENTAQRLLILAPRHPDRAGLLRDMITARGWTVAQRSRAEPISQRTQVYLADTLGEMGLWFDLAPVSFIGGSLVPVGGHNAYEAVAHGSAILTGPQISNFAALYQNLLAAGGARIVSDADAIAAAVKDLDDAGLRQTMTKAADHAVASEGDATVETADMILSALPQS